MYHLIRITLFSWLLVGMVARLQAQYGDCATAFRLCSNNQAYTFPTMLDGGKAIEIPVSDCYPAGIPERHSLWLELEAAAGGTLSFDLKPLHAGDDLDFVVYEATGPGCGQQRLLRCAATGSEYGEERVDVCVGETGLRLGDGDLQEGAGCRSESNGYLEALNLKAGQRYWVQVLNYHGWHGFELELSGSAVLRKEYALRQDESGSMRNQLLNTGIETQDAWGSSLNYQQSIGGCTVYLEQIEKEGAKGFVMEVFPNPATTELNIKWIQASLPSAKLLQTPAMYSMSIYDAKGVLADQWQYTALGLPVEKMAYPIAHLPAGIYLIKCLDVHQNTFQVLTFSKQ